MRESDQIEIRRRLYGFFTRTGASEIEAYPRTLESHVKTTMAVTADAFQMIDAKAAGMLTHVSMMIAGLGITAPLLAQHPIEEAVIRRARSASIS
jgi:hypothetical protein